MEDVDSCDGVEGDRDVEVEVARLRIVDAKAVQQNERLLEGGAADGEVGLDAIAATGLEVKGGVHSEEVGGVVEEEWLRGGVEDGESVSRGSVGELLVKGEAQGAAVAARHHTIRLRRRSSEAAACEAIAIVRLLVRRIAVLIVPNQMLVSRAAAAKAAG